MDNLCIYILCKVGQIAVYLLQPPLVASTTQQCFECPGRGEGVVQFQVDVTRKSRSSSLVCCVVRVIHTDDTVSIMMASKNDG